MDIEALFYLIVVVMMCVFLFVMMLVAIPRNQEKIDWCVSAGGIPMQESGVFRICLKPEAVIERPNDAN